MISLIDDNGETLFAEETQVAEVAQKYLNNAMDLDKAHISAAMIRSSITRYCAICSCPLDLIEDAVADYCPSCRLAVVKEHNDLDGEEDRRASYGQAEA